MSGFLDSLLIDSTPKHNVFVSFHNKDEYYKEKLEKDFGTYYKTFISKSVGDGDIDPNLKTETIRQKIRDNFIADASVTIVLIGKETWKRKHVDWEISSSIRDTQKNSRTGLVGILLPDYSPYAGGFLNSVSDMQTVSGVSFNPYNIPPRLYDNIKCGFASIHQWPKSAYELKSWIHAAYEIRKKITPDNSYQTFANNRRDDQQSWR